MACLLLLAISIAAGQDATEPIDDTDTETDSSQDTDIFSDPFSVSESETPTDELDLDFTIDGLEITGEDSEGTLNLDDVDALFQDDMVEEAEALPEGFSPEADLLSSEPFTWGGKISGSVQSEWAWENIGTGEFDVATPQNDSLAPSVSSDLFFDARPNNDFRVFGKLKISSENDGGVDVATAINDAALSGDLPAGWTRITEDNGDTLILDESGDTVFTVQAEEETESEEPQTGTPPAINLTVFELFSDFTISERLFFRFGKHTIKWGVGYFWSPADVLNLTAIDAEDPTADREGPVSLKAHFPFGQNNLYLYLITNTGARPLEIAIAPKIEFVVGTAEIGFAGYYQQALSPRVISFLSASIKDIDLFGEGVVSFGSDRVLIRASKKAATDFDEPPEDLSIVLDTFLINWLPLFSGTFGIRYINELKQRDLRYPPGNVALIGQYYFNGEGYPDSDLLGAAVFLQQNPEYNGLIMPAEAQPDSYEAPPDLAFDDISPWGRHYAAFTLGWSNIFSSNISFSALALANLSDLSGIISPALSFLLFDEFAIGLSARFTFGESGDEYTNPQALLNGSNADGQIGSTFSFSLTVSMGGGSY